jgi:hypothetical protein
LHLYRFPFSLCSMLLRRKSHNDLGGYRRAPAVTIRWAMPDDARSVEVLAELDDAPAPSGPLLLAVVGDELWVALSVSTGAAVCDPFRPSAEVATLVRERARQLTVPEPGRRRAALRRFQQAFATGELNLPR